MSAENEAPGKIASAPHAPVALFTYNRAPHTEATIRALAQCEGAGETELFVFSDAPKRPEHAESVAAVREGLRSWVSHGFRRVEIIERDRNLGLSASILDGVSRLTEKHGRVIVLEDDITAAPGFLRFLNAGLERYASEPRVAHLSAYMFPVARAGELPETFFYRNTTCWGWATWRRAWEDFRPDGKMLLNELRRRGLTRAFDIDGTAYFERMLEAQTEGRVDSWAVRWYAHNLLRGNLSLHPRDSLTANEGMDGTGVNCDVSDAYRVRLSLSRDFAFPAEITENGPALEQMKAF